VLTENRRVARFSEAYRPIEADVLRPTVDIVQRTARASYGLTQSTSLGFYVFPYSADNKSA
jgi:hypothetical protein